MLVVPVGNLTARREPHIVMGCDMGQNLIEIFDAMRLTQIEWMGGNAGDTAASHLGVLMHLVEKGDGVSRPGFDFNIAAKIHAVIDVE